MTELTLDKLKEVKGGGFSIWVCAGIIAGVVFIAGVIDGYVRPLPCRD